ALRYKADPTSVANRCGLFFAGCGLGGDGTGWAAAVASDFATREAEPVLGVFDIIHSYRELGHLVAHLNPLGDKPAGHPLLEPSEFGFSEADMERVIECANFRGCATASLRELIERLQATYCRTFGVEYLHMQDRDQRLWLAERMEPTSNRPELSADDRKRILDDLVVAEGFEQFLQLRYTTAKRFSLEGGDALIPFLDTLVEEGGTLGV